MQVESNRLTMVGLLGSKAPGTTILCNAITRGTLIPVAQNMDT